MLASGIVNGGLASKKAALRFSTGMSLLRVSVPNQRLYMTALKRNQLRSNLSALSQAGSVRNFSDAAVATKEDG